MSPIIADCRCQEPLGGGPSVVQEIEWTDYLTELTPETGPPSSPYSLMVGGPISLTINNPSATNVLNIFVTASTSSLAIERTSYDNEMFLSREAFDTGSLNMGFEVQHVDVPISFWTGFNPPVIVPPMVATKSYSISISSSVTIEFDERVTGFYDDGTGLPIGILMIRPARISVIAVPG